MSCFAKFCKLISDLDDVPLGFSKNCPTVELIASAKNRICHIRLTFTMHAHRRNVRIRYTRLLRTYGVEYGRGFFQILFHVTVRRIGSRTYRVSLRVEFGASLNTVQAEPNAIIKLIATAIAELTNFLIFIFSS